MYKRKLLALDYPTPDKFNINGKLDHHESNTPLFYSIFIVKLEPHFQM